MWQRAGKSIHAFTFRVPSDGSPMCIGRPTRGAGHGQLRVVMGPVPTNARYVSYGFLLQGKGDLWIMRPQIEILDARPEDVRR